MGPNHQSKLVWTGRVLEQSVQTGPAPKSILPPPLLPDTTAACARIRVGSGIVGLTAVMFVRRTPFRYLFELPFGRVPSDERGERGQQEHDDDQQDEFGPVEEHAALAVVLDLVERGHAVRYVVAPVPGLQRGHPQRLADGYNNDNNNKKSLRTARIMWPGWSGGPSGGSRSGRDGRDFTMAVGGTRTGGGGGRGTRRDGRWRRRGGDARKRPSALAPSYITAPRWPAGATQHAAAVYAGRQVCSARVLQRCDHNILLCGVVLTLRADRVC